MCFWGEQKWVYRSETLRGLTLVPFICLAIDASSNQWICILRTEVIRF